MKREEGVHDSVKEDRSRGWDTHTYIHAYMHTCMHFGLRLSWRGRSDRLVVFGRV